MTDYLEELLTRLPELTPAKNVLNRVVDSLLTAYHGGNKILACGNGGSAADAEHIVAELMKGFLLKRPLPENLKEKLKFCSQELVNQLQMGIPAISLVSGVGLPTAFANDVNYEASFAQQVLNLGKPGDVLISFSTSGNSKNIINAMQIAKSLGLINIGLTGNRKCKMEEYASFLITAPAWHTPRIQEYHIAIYHALCAELEKRLFA